MANALTSLIAKAKTAADSTRPRVVFALDATASRQETWNTAKRLQQRMLDTVARKLSLQLVYFNGNGTQAATWESDPDVVKSLMDSVRMVAGNTRIISTLAHACEQHAERKVAAYVFVGDAFEEDESIARQWALELAAQNIPGFFFFESPPGNAAYYSTSRDREIFKMLAACSNGAFADFDEASADKLGELLAAVAAYATGGLAALTSRDTEGARLLLAQLKK